MSDKVIVQEWPQPVKRKCFELFLQHYGATEIEARTGVPRGTVYRWSWKENWCEPRAKAVLNLDEVARDLVTDTIKTLNVAVRTASKILSRIEAQVDRDEGSLVPQNASVKESLNELNVGTEQQSDKVAVKQSHLSPSDLATLALSLKDVSDVLLRVFSK